MKYYVIIDTNVIVSALYTDNPESSTVKVIEKLYQGKLIPLVDGEEVICLITARKANQNERREFFNER